MVRHPVHIRFGLIPLKPPRRPLPLSKRGGTLIGSGVISFCLFPFLQLLIQFPILSTVKSQAEKRVPLYLSLGLVTP